VVRIIHPSTSRRVADVLANAAEPVASSDHTDRNSPWGLLPWPGWPRRFPWHLICWRCSPWSRRTASGARPWHHHRHHRAHPIPV